METPVMLQVESFNINITSEQPERMMAFYRDVVGLPPWPEIGEGAFHAGGAGLLIDGHSEIHGPAKEPARVLINFFVGDLAAEKARLEAAGVTFVRQPQREYWGGLITTFLDPDGNYLQLIEFKPQ
jgi:predicted enzyme related to lactoylglutathione lyase